MREPKTIVLEILALTYLVGQGLGLARQDWWGVWVWYPILLFISLSLLVLRPSAARNQSQLAQRLFTPFALAAVSELSLKVPEQLREIGLFFSLVAHLGVWFTVIAFTLAGFWEVIRILAGKTVPVRRAVKVITDGANPPRDSRFEWIFELLFRWQLPNHQYKYRLGRGEALRLVREESRATGVYLVLLGKYLSPVRLAVFFMACIIAMIESSAMSNLIFGLEKSDLDWWWVPVLFVIIYPLNLVVDYFIEEFERRLDRLVVTNSSVFALRGQVHLTHATVYMTPGSAADMRGAQLSSAGEKPGEENRSWLGQQIDGWLTDQKIQDLRFRSSLFGIEFLARGLKYSFSVWEAVHAIASEAKELSQFKEIAGRLVSEARIQQTAKQTGFAFAGDDVAKLLGALNQLAPEGSVEIDLFKVMDPRYFDPVTGQPIGKKAVSATQRTLADLPRA